MWIGGEKTFWHNFLRNRPEETKAAGCAACKFEAEWGTREIPHPVHPDVHTCTGKLNRTLSVQGR